jgi:hypothetical protein
VTLNGATVPINFWSATSIIITIPTGATSGPLLVFFGADKNDSNYVYFTVTSQPLPVGWLDADVGQIGTRGNASFSNGTFTVSGSGLFHQAEEILTASILLIRPCPAMGR